MLVIVEVTLERDGRPAAGSPVRVEVRDTSLADAPARTVGSATGEVRGTRGSWLETLEVVVPELPEVSTVWAHVDVDGDGRVSRGDFVTTVAYEVPDVPEARVTIRVRRV
jgi:hypothetical protein